MVNHIPAGLYMRAAQEGDWYNAPWSSSGRQGEGHGDCRWMEGADATSAGSRGCTARGTDGDWPMLEGSKWVTQYGFDLPTTAAPTAWSPWPDTHTLAPTDDLVPNMTATAIRMGRRDHGGWLELRCLTCQAWCGEGTDGQPSDHFKSKKHLNWESWYEWQRQQRGEPTTPPEQPDAGAAAQSHGARSRAGAAQEYVTLEQYQRKIAQLEERGRQQEKEIQVMTKELGQMRLMMWTAGM